MRRSARVAAVVLFPLGMAYSLGYTLGFRSGLSVNAHVPTLRDSFTALGAVPPSEVRAALREAWSRR